MASTALVNHDSDLEVAIEDGVGLTKRSPILLSTKLVGFGKLSAENYRQGIQSAWATMGVVGALLLSVTQYGDPRECSQELLDTLGISLSQCKAVHGLLQGLTFFSASLEVLLTTVLFVAIALVPETAVPKWVTQLECIIITPNTLFLATVFTAILSYAWLGLSAYGLYYGGLVGILLLSLVPLGSFLYYKIQTTTAQIIRESMTGQNKHSE
eukprot:TRINITY_DN19259_c0_g1_i1.p1 TRINITY_DN19259_c0_g1~~TRINITY_DN19259_c0_g1_i1.p1  ORF type:complete len:223 (-),score=13.81 TRINITY_DN19259_c0_g1_i1:393-1028(-)